MPSFCATTFVQEGIPSPSQNYDGSSLKTCSRCKRTNYKDVTAQKSSWKYHKKYCRCEWKPDHDTYINSLSLLDAKDEFLKTLPNTNNSGGGSSDVSHGMVYLLKHIRKLLDDKAKDPTGTDVELHLHSSGRTLIFMPMERIKTIWSGPGMADYLLSSDQEDLNDVKSRFTREHFVKYGSRQKGPPKDEWIDAYVKDEVEVKRLQKCSNLYYELESGSMFAPPSSMIFCYVYYNLVVAAAVQCPPNSCSIHDGIGTLRLNLGNDNDDRRTVAALRRAMNLWVDPFARGSCGDAMAPAASLALTAMKEFASTDSSPLSSNKRLLQEVGEFELAPGLDVVDLVVTCLSEFQERAASSQYSIDCLETMVKLTADGSSKDSVWDRLPLERRAEVILAIVAHMINHGTAHQDAGEVMMGGKTPVPRKVLMKVMDHACGQDVKKVLQVIADDKDTLGPENFGRNGSARKIVFYLIRNVDVVTASTIVKAIDALERLPYRVEEANGKGMGKLYAENETCRKMALGDMRDSLEAFRQNLKL